MPQHPLLLLHVVPCTRPHLLALSRWLYKNTCVTPNTHYVATPFTVVLAARPTCKWSSLSGSDFVQNVYDWFEFVICLPFKLEFQGNWRDHPDAEMANFTDLYGLLFETYSPAMGLGIGYLYGALLLLQKVLVIYCIGTTVKKVDLVDSGTSDHALWSLVFIHAIQAHPLQQCLTIPSISP